MAHNDLIPTDPSSMGETERNNWCKVKAAPESSDNTGNQYYRRACLICPDGKTSSI